MAPDRLLRRIVRCLPLLALLGCQGGGQGGDDDGPDPVATLRGALSTPAAPSPWTPLLHAPPAFLDTCNLLTDGTVVCHGFNTNRWHALRPDRSGSYANGTWDSPPIPPMPNGNDPSFECSGCTYSPLYYTSSVLPDGRFVVIGGEYIDLTPVWSNIGFMYDPVSNLWTPQLTSAFPGGTVGDAASSVLKDGRLVVQHIVDTNMMALDPARLRFKALDPPGKLDPNDEEGWSQLVDGTMLTVNAFTPATFERYDPATNSWGHSGSTGVNLADWGDGTGFSAELGPGVLRPDGKLAYFSGNPSGKNALYDTSENIWSNDPAMDFPLVPGETFHYAMADGAASLLPNGNVLVMASPVSVSSAFNTPSHFFELDLTTNTLVAVTDSPSAANFAAFEARMLLLPTGEVLLSAFDQGETQDVLLYSNGGAPQDAWRPVITSAPSTVVNGATYNLSGRMLNGFSEGAFYGDDAQASTNYPLVRITNNPSGHVFYARTHDHSRMGVEQVGSTEVQTTKFDPPGGVEAGPSKLVVVTNGIASQPVNVTVDRNGNHPPIARCKNASVNASSSCKGSVSINNGSSDPDGDSFSCVQAPPSPYPFGSTTVTLTCTDSKGAASSCRGVATVVDTTPPTFTSVPGPITISVCVGANIGQATATDACGPVTVTNDAPFQF